MFFPDKSKFKTAVKNNGFKILIYFISYIILLAVWETVLCSKAENYEFSGWMYAFVPAEAMFFTFVSGFFKRKKTGKIVDSLIAVLISVFYISQLVYHEIFGSFFSVSMIGMGADAVENFGWGMGGSIKAAMFSLIFVIIPLIAFISARFLYKKSLKYSFKFHIITAALTVLLWFLAVLALPLGGKESYSAYNAYHGTLIDTDTASAKIGVLANSIVEAEKMLTNAYDETPDEDTTLTAEDSKPVNTEPEINTDPNIIEELDFNYLATLTDNKDIKSVCEYAASKSGTAKNEYTGIFKGYNLIYICAESFSSYTVDPVITPTLYKLSTEGIVLNNYYNSYKNTTTNGEFSMLTSLWADVSRYAKLGTSKGSFAQSRTNLMPMGLGTLFNEQCGIVSKGYHNYLGSYYCRNETLPNLGFTCKFMNDGMTFTTRWPSSDLEMMEQSIDDYINDEQFCAYYMTFSGHGPYSDSNVIYNRNIKEVKALAKGRKYGTCALGYFATNYELEKAMSYLLTRLEEADKLKNTVIVLTGDHYPYYLYDESRNQIAGHKVDTDFEMYKSTCTIWNGGLETPISVDKYCCNVDILPTVLNLFDIKFDSRLMSGTDIFSDSTHIATLYNKSFVSEYCSYNSTNGKAVWVDGCTLTDEEKKEYIKNMSDYISSKYLLSLKIVDTDFYNFAWTNSGIKTTAPTHE